MLWENHVIGEGQGFAVAENVRRLTSRGLVSYKDCNTFSALYLHKEGQRPKQIPDDGTLKNLVPETPSFRVPRSLIEAIGALNIEVIGYRAYRAIVPIVVEGIGLPAGTTIVECTDRGHGRYEIHLNGKVLEVELNLANLTWSVYQRRYPGSIWTSSAGCGFSGRSGRITPAWSQDTKREMVLALLAI